jgi:hypothetical protein
MHSQSAEITHWCNVLHEAILRIPDCFYRDYPLDWLVENIDKSNQNAWKATLAQFNERDWCYELYHQLRLVLDDPSGKPRYLTELVDGHGESPVRLSGESSKQATYDATDESIKGSEVIRWSKNSRCRIPDILFHDPRCAEYQIFAIEVKRERAIGQVGCKGISDDLAGLIEYTQGLGFRLGFFVGLGIDENSFRAAARSLAHEVLHPDAIDHIHVCLVDDSQSCHGEAKAAEDRQSGTKPLIEFL